MSFAAAELSKEVHVKSSGVMTFSNGKAVKTRVSGLDLVALDPAEGDLNPKSLGCITQDKICPEEGFNVCPCRHPLARRIEAQYPVC